MSDPKVKKALKDLALPIKSAVTKTALLLADSIRKANNEAAKAEARKELSVTYQEKDIVWEGGVMPLLAATLGQAKDKLMLESLSLCFALAVENCLPNVNALEKTDVEKHLVELSSNSSLIVQTFASLAISHMCKLGSSTSRMKFIAAGAVRNLTNIISSPDSEELLSKQGVNKQIPYQGGQRQEAAIAALDAILVEEEAREHARSVGTIPHVVGMLQDGKSGVNKLEESIGASLEIVKSSSNRLDFCRAGGVEAVLSLVDHPSSLVRRRAAACIKEVARSQELRMNLLSSNAVYGLIALCSVSEDHLTHVEAAGALLELANESSGKAALLQYQAVPVLSTLIKGERLKDADEHVIENVLAALGFMCAYPEQNHVQEVIRLSSTGYTALQDEVGKVEVMDSIVTLCKHRSFRVKNQAAAALASLCLRHTLNSRDAGRAGASQTLFELLLASEEETIQANVLKAMLSLLRAFPPNATVLKRIGAPAQLLSIRRISSFKLIRNLSELVAEHLGCWSSVDEEGNSQIMSHLSLKLAYDEQAASSPDRWSLYLVNLRACKEAFQHIVRTEEDVMRWWKLAWLDLSSFRLTDKGASGGARGNVGHRSDLHGLEKTLKQVQDLHAKFSLLSFCDVLYMAAALALEEMGLSPVPIIYGRLDDEMGDRDEEARPEAPDFEGPEYEKPDGNPGAGNEETEEDKAAEKEEQAEGGDEVEAAPKEKQIKASKAQLTVRLERMSLTDREQVVLVGMYIAMKARSTNPSATISNACLHNFVQGQDRLSDTDRHQQDEIFKGQTSPACSTLMSSKHLQDDVRRLASSNDLFLIEAKALMAKLFALGATFNPQEGIYL